MVYFDPYSREHTDDPYPSYARPRAEAPVYYNPDRRFWALTRYDDVLAAFRDPASFISSEGVTIERVGKGMPYLLARDPPDHSWHKDFTVRLPLDVVSELIDIPEEYREEIHHWTSTSLLRGADGDPEQVRLSHVRRREIYLGLIEARRSAPRDDAITLLIDQEVTDDSGRVRRLSNDEIAYHFSGLTSPAGSETAADR